MVGGQVLSGVHGRRRRGVVGIPPKQVLHAVPKCAILREGGRGVNEDRGRPSSSFWGDSMRAHTIRREIGIGGAAARE